MEDTPRLPLQLLTHIAVIDHGHCYREMLAVPEFARFAMKNQEWLHSQMIRVIKYRSPTHLVTLYTLLGKPHREDGPAMSHELLAGVVNNVSNGIPGHNTDFWYYRGKLHSYGKHGISDYYGNIMWLKHERLHREDGPAVKQADGTKKWYKDGKLHRINGPAIIYPDGTKEWWQNGELHREDGPAVERSNEVYWYLNGIRYGYIHHVGLGQYQS